MSDVICTHCNEVIEPGDIACNVGAKPIELNSKICAVVRFLSPLRKGEYLFPPLHKQCRGDLLKELAIKIAEDITDIESAERVMEKNDFIPFDEVNNEV